MRLIDLNDKDSIYLNGVTFFGVPSEYDAYIARVAADSGTVDDSGLTLDYLNFLNREGLLPKTKLLIAPEMGTKRRVSGVNTYVTKAYSAQLPTNDAVQTTELSQPWLSGNIAPNERLALKNPSGASRFMTHPEISFAANEAWSVSWHGNYSKQIYMQLFGSYQPNNNSLFAMFWNTPFVPYFRNLTGTFAQPFYSANLSKFVNKNFSLNLVADGANNLKLYVNGELKNSFTNAGGTAFSFTNIGTANANTTEMHQGVTHSYRIQSGAMTASQVAAEYAFLRQIFPEMESVQIGSQIWTTSNFEAVATPMGNVIPEMQDNAAVERITNAADREFSSDTGFWTKSAQVTISSGILNIKSSDGSLQNATSQSILTVGKYYKLTYSVKRNASGSIVIAGSTDVPIDSTIGNGKIKIFKASVAQIILKRFFSTTDIDLDDLSVQELGWSNSTEIYDAVYAATTGTVEQKTYAAVKEAAMWCHYNNSADIGAIYGKLYNWYAAKLLQMDIDYYNVANPTTPWGWRVPTEADFNTLVATLGGDSVAGGKMKVAGTNYWSSPNTGADNSSGFSSLPAGWRTDLGIFQLGSINYYHRFYEIGGKTVGCSYNSQSFLRFGGIIYSFGVSLRLIKTT